MTAARQKAAVRRAGVSVVVGFGTTETSRIGYGCLDEGAVNNVYVLLRSQRRDPAGPDGSGAGGRS
jgi:hypothetical protein